MPDAVPENVQKQAKSPHAEREEKILAFWKEKGIFEKTLNKWPEGKAPKGEFVFYEGPPTANGRPGIHHLVARAFKDALPRYKTMQGFHVRRKGGWDTHGLPVELQVEKELGLKSKKEIDTYGIAAFNEKCKESVWKYVHEWEDFTNRIGYWVDLKDPYITYKPHYIESVWNIIKTVDEKKLLYKDYKVVPWCPRCGTGLSSHELAQGYEDVKDLSVTVKFKVEPGQKIGDFVTDDKTFILAWTTTPWTLPGNVALAVNENINYVCIDLDKQSTDQTGKCIIAEKRMIVLEEQVEKRDPSKPLTIDYSIKGKDLVGLRYEPLYPFLKDSITGPEKEKLPNAYKVYAADFVTTTDGTGIVHTAVMYGQDDFELGTKVGLPKYHLVNEDGTFKKEAGFLAGKFVKAEGVDVEIIKDLANRPSGNLLFSKEKYTHSYPHCWRCHTPLIYFARDSWYIRMSSLHDELVKENEKIHWEPAFIKEGRFGEWLREVKDWAISRERYWGTPLPIWSCDSCHSRKVVGSIEEISSKPKNEYWVMRHGEAENNTQGVMGSLADGPYHLTEKGRGQVAEQVKNLQKIDFDLVVISPFIRTQETAGIVTKALDIPAEKIITDARLGEWNTGIWNGKPIVEFCAAFPQTIYRFENTPQNGESYADVKKRAGEVLYEYEARHAGKKILFVTHEVAGCMLMFAGSGLDRKQCVDIRGSGEFFGNAEVKKIDFRVVPHNPEYELDLHRPYIDEIKLPCEKCSVTMTRAKEVVDVWFDSGAMPFAQDHYPFENKEYIDGLGGLKGMFGKAVAKGYPADFISEAIDQTRGWFYTMHAIGVLTGKGHAYKNVICLGHILDAQGKKMSKSIGNVVDPWVTMDKFGADAVRYWMYSVNQPGESKNFDEKTVDEVIKKVFNLTLNVLAFYKLYEDKEPKQGIGMMEAQPQSTHVLDRWISARLNQLISTVTNSLDNYKFFEPTRAIRDFVADLSQWYLRRSRDRFKDGAQGVGSTEAMTDKESALVTTRFVLSELSKLLAPFTPFLAEHIYGEVNGTKESVHLEDWPKGGEIDTDLIADMVDTREIASRGLEARTVAKINVRQPLALLKVKTGRWTLRQKVLGSAYVSIIREEVNVKEVKFVELATDVELETNLTPELKEEGELRELMRKIQDMRKEKGLAVGDMAVLIVGEAEKELADKYSDQLKKTTSLSAIESGASLQLKA